jgi:mono/diheme cytochrome c family protein
VNTMRRRTALRAARTTCFAAIAATALTATLGAQAGNNAMPEAAGSEVVRARCLSCHEADLIVQQRLGRPAWVRELEKMMRWGAVLTDAERDRAADYLARHYGPARSAAAAAPSREAATAAGAAIFERKCLGCHQADIVQQQRLGQAGWGREIDKMVRWGASVAEAEREDLARYLTERFGPR